MSRIPVRPDFPAQCGSAGRCRSPPRRKTARVAPENWPPLNRKSASEASSLPGRQRPHHRLPSGGLPPHRHRDRRQVPAVAVLMSRVPRAIWFFRSNAGFFRSNRVLSRPIRTREVIETIQCLFRCNGVPRQLASHAVARPVRPEFPTQRSPAARHCGRDCAGKWPALRRKIGRRPAQRRACCPISPGSTQTYGFPVQGHAFPDQ